MNILKINGIKVSYRTYGSSSDPAILLLHGNSSGSAIFEHQFTEAFKDYFLVAPDFYGHGSSGLPDNSDACSMEELGKLAKALIGELDLKHFIIYGVSLGGHVAIELANHLPGLKGIAFSGTPPVPLPFEFADFFNADAVDQKLDIIGKKELTKEECELWAKACIYESKELHRFISELIKQTNGQFRLNFGASVGQGIGIQNEKEIVEQIEMPVAIFEGEFEHWINNEYIRTLNIKKLFKNEVVVIPGSAHYPNLENPERFNETLKSFAEFCFGSE